jgi:hypothetical protein
MTTYSWTCPFRGQPTTVTDNDRTAGAVNVLHENAYGGAVQFTTSVIICPNPDCKQLAVTFQLHELKIGSMGQSRGAAIKQWRLLPSSSAMTFPDFVPKPIRDDYEEACAILDLSPKASATLSRRALQGMIRDYWGIVKKRLIDEIAELENKVDPLTWEAIDAVRSIGNIGAHMEKDINIIVDVEPEEANKLIQLIEILVKDWYVTRHDREERLKAVIAAKQRKDDAKKN